MNTPVHLLNTPVHLLNNLTDAITGRSNRDSISDIGTILALYLQRFVTMLKNELTRPPDGEIGRNKRSIKSVWFRRL